MNAPNPAVVTERAAARLPRVPLLLLCAAYLLPGLFARDPWRNADMAAFGYMLSLAEGRSPWLAPALGGVPAEPSLLPYWLGAVSIKLFGSLFGAPMAARIPFALMLVFVLVLIWYATYHLARSEAAQPVPFAFGGEAHPVDYARAVADGALLAVLATLGLLQLGHETTPELAQLAAVTLFVYGLASSADRPVRSRVAMLMALPALAASGAPTIAVALGVAGCLASWTPLPAAPRGVWAWCAGSTLLAALVAFALGAWGWRVTDHWPGVPTLLRQWAWFTWPSWLLGCWTLWRWHRQLTQPHIAIPLGATLVAIAASVTMGGSDRPLMLAVPPMAVLAAFALPTLRRSTTAAIDWFSLFFFSFCALAIWVIYLSVHTGVPAQPAANVARLLPGFTPVFQPIELGVAVLATLAWFALVRWRTGRHRHPLWKSLVLPASGVALCWLLLMSLWLPMFDYGRSFRPLMERIAPHLPRGTSVCAGGLPPAQVAALEQMGYRVDATADFEVPTCRWAMRLEPRAGLAAPGGWRLVARVVRPSNREEFTAIYRREPR